MSHSKRNGGGGVQVTANQIVTWHSNMTICGVAALSPSLVQSTAVMLVCGVCVWQACFHFC